MSTSAEHMVALNASGERRFYRRITPTVLIYVAFGPNNLGMLVNVSENGLLVFTPCGLDLNSVYRVSLRLNGLPNVIEVHVRTAWTTQLRKRSGIQLLDLSEHDREQIRKWGALQHPRNENLDRWFSSEKPESSPETPELTPVLAKSPEKHELAPALVASSPSFNDLHADRPQNDEFFAPDNESAPRTSTRWSKPVLIVWSASMAAICFITAWSARHNLSDRFLHRPAHYAKASALAVDHSPSHRPSLVALNTPGTLAPSRIPNRKNAGPNIVLATAAFKASSLNIPVSKSLEAAPVAKPNLTASPKHAFVSEASDSSDSDVADSNFGPFPTDDAIPATADPAETRPSANVSATNDSTTKILPGGVSTSKSAIAGSISNSKRPRDLYTSTPSDGASIAAPAPAFSPPSPVGRTTYVERKSAPTVIHMAVPEDRVVELTPPSSRTASFVNLPGERVLRSASVTMHIQRSVWVHGDHWPWHSNRKVALGELTSRVDPQISRLPTASGTLTVQATIDKNGRVSQLRPVNGSSALLPSVARAIREWRYEPTYLDNKPVETQAQVEVDFHVPTTAPPYPRLNPH